MSIENAIFNGLANGMDADTKVGLVLDLADKLQVRNRICTADDAAEVARAEAARMAHERAATPICNGETVRTEHGEARALVLTPEQQEGLRAVLAGLNG